MQTTTPRVRTLARAACVLTACATAAYLAAATSAAAGRKPARASPSMAAGWTVAQLAKSRGVLFVHPLKDVPGKDLVVVRLNFPPQAAQQSKSALRCTAHTHPGSVWVYVTNGTARLGIAGEPVQVVRTGQSFYEPKGAIHAVAESASATEPASAIAVMIVPEGAALATPAPAGCAKR